MRAFKTFNLKKRNLQLEFLYTSSWLSDSVLEQSLANKSSIAVWFTNKNSFCRFFNKNFKTLVSLVKSTRSGIRSFLTDFILNLFTKTFKLLKFPYIDIEPVGLILVKSFIKMFNEKEIFYVILYLKNIFCIYLMFN